MANYEVVISGIAGSVPECLNLQQLEDTIFTNENLITEINQSRWKNYPLDVPPYLGLLKDTFEFDQTFFGIHSKLTQVMDIHARHSLERSFEAICDAGINPDELAGTNAAVIMCSMTSETEFGSVSMSKNSGYAMVGHSRSMQANRVSYFFDMTGPSFVLNASWTGAMQGLEMAANLVRKGETKLAIVGATNVMYSNPTTSVPYDSLRLLNSDGKTKSFSADADGYCRSSGTVVFVLQRADEALRSYASIVKVHNSTEVNHSYPFVDRVGFQNFLKDFYSGLQINKSDIGYIEGDGAASLKSDAMELNSYAEIICPGRNAPLSVGSCKPKLGHGESAAAFMSILNALISFKTGYIPPTLHFSSPNPLVPALFDGRLKVVTEKTPLEGDLIGITSVGIGSIYAHVLLKRNPRSCPRKDISYYPPDDLPRLFLLSGRDENRMKQILTEVISKPVDEHYFALNYKLFKKNFTKHLFRGYSLITKGQSSINVIPNDRDLQRPVWYIFSGMGSQWNEMGTGLMMIPIVRRAIEKCHNVLLPKGLDLISILTSKDPTIYDNILHAFVGIAAIQVGLVDLLEELGVQPDGIVGHSVGELGCAYADKCLTAEQIILGAYFRGKASNEAKVIKGMMAAVGKGYSQIKDELPDGIEVACHNSESSSTLSGPAEIMEKYVAELTSKGIFAKLVNVANIAYHSKYIKPVAPYLLKGFKECVPEPKFRSKKWISSSIPESQWDSDLAKYCSAEYHTNNLLSQVLFEEATRHIPQNAICIEISPHGLLQAIVKKSLPSCTHIPLTNRTKGAGCGFLVEALGSLFLNGVEIDLTKFYPQLKYPLPRETDYITYITWLHPEQSIPMALLFEEFNYISPVHWKSVKYGRNENNFINLKLNHTIKGNSIFLKSKILETVMTSLGDHLKAESKSVNCFAFEDIIFHKDLHFVDEKTYIALETLFQFASGTFEALYNEETITTGNLSNIKKLPELNMKEDFAAKIVKQTSFSENQIYDFFEMNDCIFNGPMRNIASISISKKGFIGKVKWRGSTELYLDAHFKLLELYSSIKHDTLMEISQIFKLFYDPTALPETNEDIDVYYDENLGYLSSKGVSIMNPKTKPSGHHTIHDKVDIKNLQFIPYSKLDPKNNYVQICLQIFKENSYDKKLIFDCIIDEESQISHKIMEFMQNNEVELRMRKEVSNNLVEKEFTVSYLIIAENNYTEHINMLVKSNLPFYFFYIGGPAELKKHSWTKDLTTVIEHEVDGRRVVLYKQRKRMFDDTAFVEIPGDNVGKEIETINDDVSNKTYFFIIKYRILTDVINTLQSSYYHLENHNKRFVYIDESSPPFDPNNDFFKEQLAKDLKINIAYRRSWGSIRDIGMIDKPSNIKNCTDFNKPLHKIRSKNVDLHAIGLNLQSLTLPKKYKKLAVIEYSGMIGNKAMFGIGKLTKDNILEVDPQLCWEKPVHWSFEDASTVPLYYSMAYHILYIQGKCTNRPHDSVFIHGGHTTFAHAIFAVGIEMGAEVYSTCYSQEQKNSILDRFPQIKENHIIIMSDDKRNVFLNILSDLRNGKGISLVIDTQEDNDLRNITLECVRERGTYFLITNNDMECNHTFGMSVFLTEVRMIGYNPELIFDACTEDKLAISSCLDSGMKNNVVKPLERKIISTLLLNEDAVNIIETESHKVLPKKIIVPIKKLLSDYQLTKEITEKKIYVIIGAYNCLWFDILKWLVSNGADIIHVVLNQDEIPPHLKERFNNFVETHKFTTIVVSGIENINSAQSSNTFIKEIKDIDSIDTLFYMKPGFEKQISNIDYALRMHSKSSSFVSIGLQACIYAERRRNDGFKGVSFIMMKDSSLKNWMILNALDKWSKKGNESVSFITVAKLKRREKKYEDKHADILPSNDSELVDLQKSISNKPRFVEINTMCLKKRYARDVNPVFVFPGLKIKLLEKFVAQLIYPAYVARYPQEIKSLDDIAVTFSEMLTSTFDYNMFTLIAEGWSGPLALSIAKLLEAQGILSEVILLDGAPETVKRWNRRLFKSNIVAKYMPVIKDGKRVSTSVIKNWSSKICNLIKKEEDSGYTEDEIQIGFETLIDRLDIVQDFTSKNKQLESTVHLFTQNAVKEDVDSLKEMCNSFHHHVLESSDNFLENHKLVNEVNNLPLLEYKTCAKKQIVKDVASSKLIIEFTARLQKEKD